MNENEFAHRRFLKAGAMLGSILAMVLGPYPSRLQAAPQPRPNVVFILTDDQRIGDFGCYGNTKAITPNVDALAARGTRFRNAMVTCPVCGPSRVNLLTGRYLSRFLEAPCNEKCYFPSTEPTIAGILRAAGYQTAIVGKIHFKVNDIRGTGGARVTIEAQLKAVGFSFIESVHGYDANPGIHLKEQTKAFDSAIKFVKENKERPFALFVFTTLTHGPFEAPDKYQKMVEFKGGWSPPDFSTSVCERIGY